MNRTTPKNIVSFAQADVILVNAQRILVAQGHSLTNFVDLELDTTVEVRFLRTCRATPRKSQPQKPALRVYNALSEVKPENIRFRVPANNLMWQQFGTYFEFLKASGVARVIVEGTDAKSGKEAYLEFYTVKLHAPQNGMVTGQLIPMREHDKDPILGEYGRCECSALTFTPVDLVQAEALKTMSLVE